MAHLSVPVLHLEGDGDQGISILRNISPNELPPAVQELIHKIPLGLNPFLPKIILSKPDDGRFSAFVTKYSSFTIWLNHVDVPEKVKKTIWREWMLPVQDQGNHECCWSIMDAEHVSEARHIHKIDEKLTSYSGQYLIDFVNREEATKRYVTTKREHYCYSYSGFLSLQFAMNHGMPTCDAYKSGGCSTRELPPECDAKLTHVLNDVRYFTDVNKALHYFQIQPIRGCLALFFPEFSNLGRGIYRGPTCFKSRFSGWHAVSLCSISVEKGETVALVKTCHGTKKGVEGFHKISLDVILYQLETTEDPSFTSPSRLIKSFYYGEVRKEFEKEVVEVYIEGQKVDQQVRTSEYMTTLFLEGIFHNTSGNVYQNKDGQEEIIGSPVDRALLKWAIKLDKNFVSINSKSVVIKGSQKSLKPIWQSIAVDCEKTNMSGIRIHWKGNASYILGKCTKYASEDKCLEMSETKRTLFKDAIDSMAARNLICITLAYKDIERSDVPPQSKIEKWECEDLVMLAIFAIKDPCPPARDDEMRAPLDFETEFEAKIEKEGASKVHLVERPICPIFEKFGDMEGIVDEDIQNETPPHDGISWLDSNREYAGIFDKWRKELKELHEDSESDDDEESWKL